MDDKINICLIMFHTQAIITIFVLNCKNENIQILYPTLKKPVRAYPTTFSSSFFSNKTYKI